MLLDKVFETSDYEQTSVFLNFVLDLKSMCKPAAAVADCLKDEIKDCIAEKVSP